MNKITETDITIPRESIEAAACEIFANPSDPIDWDVARAACLAMIRAWPGMWKECPLEHEYLCLPLTQESGE